MAVLPTAGYARSEYRRERLLRFGVHVCRNCRAAVRADSARELPGTCPACGTAGRDLWVPVGRRRMPR